MPSPTPGVDDGAVRSALAGVVDPCCREREISVLDMGLLQDIEIDDDRVRVEIVLTSGWCPFQLDLVDTITAAVDAVPGVASSEVAITLDEAWSTARLSDDARRKLQFLPQPGAVDRDRFVADRVPARPPSATVPGPHPEPHRAAPSPPAPEVRHDR